MIFDTHELAWAAGFFDGEGTTTLRAGGNGQPALSVSQAANPDGAIPDTLIRFRDSVGIGSITGPYQPRRPQSLLIYRFSAYGYERTQAIIAMLWPWLAAAKRAQASGRLIACREAHWRSRRDGTVCPRGHRWVGEHMSYIDARGTKVCRICTRENHRHALDPIRVRPYKPRPSRQAGFGQSTGDA